MIPMKGCNYFLMMCTCDKITSKCVDLKQSIYIITLLCHYLSPHKLVLENPYANICNFTCILSYVIQIKVRIKKDKGKLYCEFPDSKKYDES